jgi:protein-L-isoaspartate O-methyltransferase
MVWVMAHGNDHSSQPSGEIPPLFRDTAQDDESVAQMVALLDYQDALPSARRLHDWAIETAAIQPGDHVVDLGSGTGTMSRQLASLVADGVLDGRVIGVEPNPHLRAVAASRAKAAGVTNVSLSRDSLARFRSTTQPSISSGVSACCSISLIRSRRSMT